MAYQETLLSLVLGHELSRPFDLLRFGLTLAKMLRPRQKQKQKQKQKPLQVELIANTIERR